MDAVNIKQKSQGGLKRLIVMNGLLLNDSSYNSPLVLGYNN